MFDKVKTGKIFFAHRSHNKDVKPIKIIRRKQLWQTMQTTAAMQATQAMPTIPARILLTALRIPVLRIPARMQATQITATTKRQERRRAPKGARFLCPQNTYSDCEERELFI